MGGVRRFWGIEHFLEELAPSPPTKYLGVQRDWHSAFPGPSSLCWRGPGNRTTPRGKGPKVIISLILSTAFQGLLSPLLPAAPEHTGAHAGRPRVWGPATGVWLVLWNVSPQENGEEATHPPSRPHAAPHRFEVLLTFLQSPCQTSAKRTTCKHSYSGPWGTNRIFEMKRGSLCVTASTNRAQWKLLCACFQAPSLKDYSLLLPLLGSSMSALRGRGAG